MNININIDINININIDVNTTIDINIHINSIININIDIHININIEEMCLQECEETGLQDVRRRVYRNAIVLTPEWCSIQANGDSIE